MGQSLDPPCSGGNHRQRSVTSPATIRASPDGVARRSAPSSSMPRTAPVVRPSAAVTVTVRPVRHESASHSARSAAKPPAAKRATRCLQLGEQPRRDRGAIDPSAAGDGERRRGGAQLGREGARRRVQVDADAGDHECTRSTSASISVRTPATLRPSSRTSFGHLSCAGAPVSADRGRDREPATSASCGTTVGRATGGARSSVEVQARGRVPRPPEPPASRRLRLGDHDRPLRRPGARELARHPLRRVDLGVPHDPPPRAAEMRRQLGRPEPIGRRRERVAPARGARRSGSPAPRRPAICF